MRKDVLIRRHPFVTVAAIAATALTACDELGTDPDGSGTYFGPAESLGNGHVRTYVELDENGAPTDIGVAITENAFSGLPAGPEPLQLVLTFAAEAEQTPFQHVLFDWNPPTVTSRRERMTCLISTSISTRLRLPIGS